MYLPDIFKTIDNKKCIEFIKKHSFADLITYNDHSICSNKVPLLLDSTENILYGHFANANSQLIDISESAEVLAIFSGPQSYISPHWYHSDNMVPTWNFQTLQVKGRASVIDDQRLIWMLEKLSACHEASNPTPWTMKEIKPDQQALLLPATHPTFQPAPE